MNKERRILIDAKKCTKCGITKKLSEYKNILRRGKRVIDSRCAECVAEYKRKHYEQNREYYLEKSRKWAEDNPDKVKEYQERYYKENAERLRAQKREYSRRPEVIERQNERFREYRKDPEFLKRERVRGMVNKRIQSGKIKKPDSCEECGETGYVEAHHEDYEKPFEVVWVCKLCHENIHHSNEGRIS